MNRSLKLSVLAALALGSSQALALNLGQIQVKSALGQPLRVEIPVNPASPAELQNLSARLASSDAFTRAGITDGRPSVPLQFKVADEHGHKVILVTSSVPVNNPYIDLLIEVSSAAGTSVHEYPVLLDPPTGKLAGATSGGRHVARHAAASHASAASPHPSATTRPAPASGVKNGEYGPVQRGQTLSAVARDVMPSGVNIDQMMLALKQANPDAFYRDNINALKAGAVLRVPSRDDALAMKVAEAAAAVRRQNSDWSGGATRTPTSVAAAATRANASTSPTSHASTGDRLALVPAGDSGQGAGSGGGKHGSAASLRQDLQRSQETLASLQQQSADLNSRLKDLKDINSKNQRLLSLKDNEIAALQARLAAARKAAGLPPPKPLAATPAPAEASSSSSATAPLVAAVTSHETSSLATAPAHAGTASTTVAPAVGSSAAATAPAAVASKPAAKPAVKKPVVHPRPAVHRTPSPEQPWYMQTWAMIAGAAIVVLGLLMLLASRGRRGKPAAPGRPGPSSLADRFGDAPIPPAAGSADPDQDELLDQLAEHPDDVGLHLELVSLYYSRRDVEHFEAAAEAMYAHVTSPEQDEWQDVVHMGEDLTPGHPLFAHADESHVHHDADGHDEVVPPRTEDEIQALNEFDLDSYADETPVGAQAETLAGPTPPPLRPNQKVSEYHFDFNLTPQQARAQAAAEEAEAAAVPVKPVEPAVAPEDEAVSSWNFDEPATTSHAEPAGDEFGDFGELNDGSVDTKLDLARAYLDMGDPDGARAMLEEVMQEGTQMQKDVAKGLLEKLA